MTAAIERCETWSWFDSGIGGAAWNMALDAALLEQAPLCCGPAPLLRFYGWEGAPASFGYSQRLAAVSGQTALRPLVRRPTGGGLVDHDRDWTYSLVVPASHEWHSLRAAESYRRIHDWVVRALATLGLQTELAPQTNPGLATACFARAEQFDVIDAYNRATKVAGAAQRRTRSGLLIQGSILPPRIRQKTFAQADWQKAMRQTACSLWAVGWKAFQITPEIARRARELVAAKFGAGAFLTRI